MRNKVMIITSRFGSVSEFFDLWLRSASKNQEFDFLILTDLDIKYEWDNITFVKYKNFSDFINHVDKKIGFKTHVTTPFKTADLRPAYAYLFGELIQKVYQSRYQENGNYDFWGYIDTDMIIGKLTNFINDYILDNCDVFQSWGHFTLVRNVEKFNTLYKKPYKSYLLKRSLKLPENCMVEEGPFILQLKSEGAIIDSKVSRIADIKRNVFGFTIDGINYDNQRFIYLDGEIKRIAKKEDGTCVSDEFMYIHFMKRIIKDIPVDCENLLLTENGFLEYDGEKIFIDAFSQEAYDKWNTFTRSVVDSRYKTVSLLYKLIHLDNWIYRKKLKNIEMEKRKLIQVFYEL